MYLFKGWIQASAHLEWVGEFADAESAMRDLPNRAVDVVMVDINLPGSNGIECVRVLKTQMEATQFMMVTVYSDSELIFDALGAGAAGYLLKRSTRNELLAAIAEIASGGSPMSGGIARMITQSFRRQAPVVPAMDHLAPQEQRVLELMAQGFAHKEIAAEMGVANTTVGTYVRRIYDKFHVYTRAQAIAKYQGR